MNNELLSIIRPKTFDDYFGQAQIINELKVYIYSAKKQKTSTFMVEKKCVGDSLFLVFIVWQHRIAGKRLSVHAESDDSGDGRHVAKGHPINRTANIVGVHV